MATVYRDYGYINDGIVPDNVFNVNKKRQVYLATHEGENYLPFMKRSFISFSFGGRHIEDFNLIAITNGNSLGRSGSAPFEDITSTYDNLEGQQYWNTHYKANQLDLTLVSDGIDQRELDDFLYWFRAGDTKELILAEHPNRAILARIANPPALELLPFEEKITVPISNYTYETSTTLYKGTINISFVMDSPHWYSVTNILGEKEEHRYIDYWTDANGNRVEIFASKDALKILYEDGIPLGSMIQHNMLLGNGGFANVDNNIICQVWSIANDEDLYDPETGELLGEGARIEADDAVAPFQYGIVAGAIIEATGEGINSLSARGYVGEDSNENCGFFYYSGTAPSPTIISFELTPTFDEGYINTPANSYKKNGNKSYDTFTVESRNKQELCFTTPNVFTSYNKVINIFKTYITPSTTKTWEDIRQMLREEVRHVRVREWANKVINDLGTNANIQSSDLGLVESMQEFLLDSNNTVAPVTFTFNSENGEATGKFKYRYVTSPFNLTEVEEDVGDMLRSNYIIIRDRNYPTSTGAIEGWTVAHKEYSHRIYHTVQVPLEKVQILYKNMYL